MSRLTLVSLILLGLLGPRLLAADEPRDLIEKAIAAQGGAELLGRDAAVVMKIKVGLHEPVEGLVFSGTLITQGSTRNKMDLDIDVGGNRMALTVVRDGQSGWKRLNGMEVEDLSADDIREMDRMVHAERVSQLVPLTRDKEFTLESLGEDKVEGKAVVGVKVKAAGKPDVSLYFDKETHLLRKVATREKHFSTGQDALHETVLENYREASFSQADEDILKSAKVATDGPSLVEFLAKRKAVKVDVERIKALIKQLGDDDFSVRDKATKELAEVGAAASGLLRDATKDSDPEIALRATSLLQMIGDRSGAAVPAAVRLVAWKRPEGAVAVLLDIATWPGDEETGREARAALMALAVRDGKPDKVLAEALEDKDPARKAVAEAVLGKDGGKSAKEAGVRVHMTGLKLPMKSTLYLDGKKSMEKEVLGAEFFNRLDDSVFAKPK